jgi:hypothetical protein
LVQVEGAPGAQGLDAMVDPAGHVIEEQLMAFLAIT